MNNSNAWDQIDLRLNEAINMMRESVIPNMILDPELWGTLKEKYEAGSLLHENEWMDWPPEKFISNAEEEILDCILYIAMDLVREERARRYGNPRSSYNEAQQHDSVNCDYERGSGTQPEEGA